MPDERHTPAGRWREAVVVAAGFAAELLVFGRGRDDERCRRWVEGILDLVAEEQDSPGSLDSWEEEEAGEFASDSLQAARLALLELGDPRGDVDAAEFVREAVDGAFAILRERRPELDRLSQALAIRRDRDEGEEADDAS